MDKVTLPLATFVIIIAQLGGVIWFGADLAARVNAIESRLESAEVLPLGSGQRLAEMSDRLARIETKLEILMETKR
jgi:hypothetical protein